MRIKEASSIEKIECKLSLMSDFDSNDEFGGYKIVVLSSINIHLKNGQILKDNSIIWKDGGNPQPELDISCLDSNFPKDLIKEVNSIISDLNDDDQNGLNQIVFNLIDKIEKDFNGTIAGIIK